MSLQWFLSSIFLFLIRFINSSSLYDTSDPILELNTSSFNLAVYNSENSHFVEFYSSWCGACIAYAPTFKIFARHLAPWKPFVEVTVVDCADDFNLPLCREHSVNSFPTIKYFKHHASSKDDGLLYRGNKYEIDEMVLDVASLVQADFEKQHHHLREIFHPIKSSEYLTNIWESAGSVNFVGIAIQEHPSTLAWALVINFHKHKNARVVLARPQHPEVIQYLGHEAENRFLLFKRGDTTAIWISPIGAKWKDIQEKVNELISESGGIISIPEERISVKSQAPVPVSLGNITQYQVQLIDLKSTLSYMLFKEIPRRGIIDGENLVTLKHWMTTVSKYTPGTTPMRRFLYRFNEWLEGIDGKLGVDDWNNKLEEIQITLGNPLSKEIQWLACAGSKPNLRGYTCGLWTLAHIISIEADKIERNNPRFNPLNEVMEPFYKFIFYFLSCTECAKNFKKEAAKHKLTEVSSREEMVMWFWRVHNFVNARLSGAPSDDPLFPKRQFPPPTLCAQCYDTSGAFDETQVLHFLREYYGNIRQDSSQVSPEYKITEYQDGRLRAIGTRQLNPKFDVHADKINNLEEAEERLRKELNANPRRSWKDIEGFESLTAYKSRTQFYFIWLSIIGFVIMFAYWKYRRNRSKFWKTFYYHNDFKMCMAKLLRRFFTLALNDIANQYAVPVKSITGYIISKYFAKKTDFLNRATVERLNLRKGDDESDLGFDHRLVGNDKKEAKNVENTEDEKSLALE